MELNDNDDASVVPDAQVPEAAQVTPPDEFNSNRGRDASSSQPTTNSPRGQQLRRANLAGIGIIYAELSCRVLTSHG